MLSKDGVLAAIRCGDDTAVSVSRWPKDGSTEISLALSCSKFGGYELNLS